jgi:hypothetical protein
MDEQDRLAEQFVESKARQAGCLCESQHHFHSQAFPQCLVNAR